MSQKIKTIPLMTTQIPFMVAFSPNSSDKANHEATPTANGNTKYPKARVMINSTRTPNG